MQPSRRAFLFGRQTPLTPWQAFRERLARGVQGRVQGLGDGSMCRLRLVPAWLDDVRHARALCAEYGVTLLLDGLEEAGAALASAVPDPVFVAPAGADSARTDSARTDHTSADPAFADLAPADPASPDVALGSQDGPPVLYVDPSLLNAITPESEAGWWLAQPGCRLGDLADAGLSQFRDAPVELTLAAWLAHARGWAPGMTAAGGLVGIDVLLSDGTTERLGPFGASDLRPLRSATVQRLVPALFQLSTSPDSVTCRNASHWPCRYRLDALLPAEAAEVNLAHLLLGHGGSLAWVESLVLTPGEAWAGLASTSAVAGQRRALPPVPADVEGAARRLERRIKTAFDPLDLYGD